MQRSACAQRARVLNERRTQLELHVCRRVWVYDDLTSSICVVAGVSRYYGQSSWSVFSVQRFNEPDAKSNVDTCGIFT